MSALTKVARRELHHTYSSFKAACTVPDGDLKSTLDGVVLMGYTRRTDDTNLVWYIWRRLWMTFQFCQRGGGISQSM